MDLIYPDTKAKLEKDIARTDDIHPAPDGTANLDGQPEKKSRPSRIWKRVKGGKRDGHSSENKADTRDNGASTTVNTGND